MFTLSILDFRSNAVKCVKNACEYFTKRASMQLTLPRMAVETVSGPRGEVSDCVAYF